jgi:toxin YoeB
MILAWAENAWEDYLYWQQKDRKTLRRINALIKDTMRQPFSGLGDPEPLKHNWLGYWSRRIDREHRLVYRVTDNNLVIAQCRYHY